MVFSVTTSECYPAIREWEEAGVALYDALSRYLELTSLLGKRTLGDRIPPAYSVERIECALGSLHDALDQHLAESRSVLAQTLNLIRPPIHRFPDEVLSQIFMHVVSALDPPQGRYTWTIKERFLERYRVLHNILGVCALWRNVALSEGALWSVVPCLWWLKPGNGTSPADVAERITHRAKTVNLTLAAPESSFLSENISILAANASRFRAVDIVTSFTSSICEVMEMFADQRAPEHLALTHLSIHRGYNNFEGLPGEDDYILGSSSSQGDSYNRLFSRLSVLQIRGSLLHWDQFPPTEQLTTIHLQEVMLGYDSALIHLLKALSSATQLRELKLIRVKTYLDNSPLEELLRHSKVSLRSLELLVIQGLYFNTWRLILSSIQSRSHRLSFVFTRKSRWLIRREVHDSEEREAEDQGIPIQAICEAMRRMPVHALLLDTETRNWDRSQHVVSTGELEKLLEAAPFLETLWMNIWNLSHRYCRALQRSRTKHGNNFESLRNLYFSGVEFPASDAFKKMVKGYARSLRRVALGSSCKLIPGSGDGYSYEREELASWLETNVPEFEAINSGFEPPEFRSIMWQELW